MNLDFVGTGYWPLATGYCLYAFFPLLAARGPA